MKYLLLLALLNPVAAYAFNLSEFKKGCKAGVLAGQKFLNSSIKAQDLLKIQQDCVLDKKGQEKLTSLSTQESYTYGCGGGVSLSLLANKQTQLLKSPRAREVIDKCAQKKK